MIALLFAALFIHDGNQTGAVHGDGCTAATFDVLEIHELDDAVVARFERGALGDARSGSTNVERAHGELRARFANGLRGGAADGFAAFHHPAGGMVAAVADRATAAAGYT